MQLQLLNLKRNLYHPLTKCSSTSCGGLDRYSVCQIQVDIPWRSVVQIPLGTIKKFILNKKDYTPVSLSLSHRYRCPLVKKPFFLESFLKIDFVDIFAVTGWQGNNDTQFDWSKPQIYRWFSFRSCDILSLVIPNNKTVEHWRL